MAHGSIARPAFPRVLLSFPQRPASLPLLRSGPANRAARAPSFPSPLTDTPGPRVIVFLFLPRVTGSVTTAVTAPTPPWLRPVLALHLKLLLAIKTGCPHHATPISSFGAAAALALSRATLTLAPPPSPPASPSTTLLSFASRRGKLPSRARRHLLYLPVPSVCYFMVRRPYSMSVARLRPWRRRGARRRSHRLFPLPSDLICAV